MIKIFKAAHEFGLTEAIARKLIASSHLSIMLNGEKELIYKYLPTKLILHKSYYPNRAC